MRKATENTRETMQNKTDDNVDDSAYVDSFFLPGGILDPDDVIDNNENSNLLSSTIRAEKVPKPDIFELPSIPVASSYSPWRNGGNLNSPLRNAASTPMPLSVGQSYCSSSAKTPDSAMLLDGMRNDLETNATISAYSSDSWFSSVEIPAILHPSISFVSHSPLPLQVVSSSQTPVIVPPGFETTQLESTPGWIEEGPTNVSQPQTISSLIYGDIPGVKSSQVNGHRVHQKSHSIPNIPEKSLQACFKTIDSTTENEQEKKVVKKDAVNKEVVAKAVTVPHAAKHLSYSLVTLKNINGKALGAKSKAESQVKSKNERIVLNKPTAVRSDRIVGRQDKPLTKEYGQKQIGRLDESNEVKVSKTKKPRVKSKQEIDENASIQTTRDYGAVKVSNISEAPAPAGSDDANPPQLCNSLLEAQAQTKSIDQLDVKSDWKIQKNNTKQSLKNGIEKKIPTSPDVSPLPPASWTKTFKREIKVDESLKGKVAQVVTMENKMIEQSQHLDLQTCREDNTKEFLETSSEHEHERHEGNIGSPASVDINSRDPFRKKLNMILNSYKCKVISVYSPVISSLSLVARIICQSLLVLVLTVGYMLKYAADETTSHSVFGVFWGSPSVLCYYVFCLMPIVSSWLMAHVGNLPHFTPHLLSNLSVYIICRVLGHVSTDPSTHKRKTGKKFPPNAIGGSVINNTIKLSHQNYDSFGIDVCHVIRRTIMIALPIGFLVDGFNKNDSSFMLLEVRNRMIIAYLLSLVKHGHILSPVAWVGWSAQMLLSRYLTAGFMLHMLQFFLGLAFIRLVSILRAMDSTTLREEAAR